MSVEPKHKNLKDEYKIKELVPKKFYIRRDMSILVAFEWHYFQELLNCWHSNFKHGAREDSVQRKKNGSTVLTINVPLILKVQEVIFFS